MICSDEFGGLHFFNAGNLVSRGGFLHQRRIMECWVLIYVLSGSLEISSGGTERSVKSGEWLFLRPGEEHFGSSPSTGELSYLWAHFSPETPFFEAESGKAYTLPEYGTASSERVGVIFRQLVDCSRRSMYTGHMTECALEMLLTELTQEYVDSCGNVGSSTPLIADINEWIRLNCHRQITINDVAEAAAGSRRYERQKIVAQHDVDNLSEHKKMYRSVCGQSQRVGGKISKDRANRILRCSEERE